MSFSRCLLTLFAAMLCLSPMTVLAQQQDFSQSIVATKEPLSSSQQAVVKARVASLANQLKTGTPQQISEARQQMLALLVLPGASEIYKKALSLEISRQLISALEADEPIVRLNTMIIAAELSDASAINLVTAGLLDTSPATRYWAGRAVSQLNARTQLSESDTTQILDVLVQALNSETSEQVIKTMLVGMVDLNTPASIEQALVAMKRRMSMHALNPELSLAAEQESLSKLLRNTINADSHGKVNESLRMLASVAIHYLSLSASALDKGGLNEIAEREHRQMVDLTDNILRWSVPKLASGVTTPASLESAVKSQSWVEVLLRVEEWKNLLEKNLRFEKTDLP